jgi:hypothetical protein
LQAEIGQKRNQFQFGSPGGLRYDAKPLTVGTIAPILREV